jgi:uncharacterized protein YgbK (DUF1537 family)
VNPAYGFYGDDVTGSVDALLQWQRAGAEATLVLSPDDVASATTPVVGIAGTARSLPTDAMPAELTPAFESLRDARIVQYKACSTVDSSPEVGSLGRALELGRAAYGAAPVPLLFAQPDFGRYTVFGHHFARDGSRVWRLDRQPTMARHPVTPMDESDIALHLARQTSLRIGSVPWTSFASLGTELRDPAYDAYVLDALCDDHVNDVGTAVAGLAGGETVFCMGSGGLTLGLARAVVRDPALAPPAMAAAVDGPMLVVSGSGSGRTWQQVQAAIAAGWVAVPLDAGAADRAAAAYRDGSDVVVFSATGSVSGIATDVSEALADVIRACHGVRPLPRLIVCGGDTSGRVLTRLGVRSIRIRATPWGNAPLLGVTGGEMDGTDVVLKGGQVGGVDLFEQVRRGS